ncbi:MAG: hypothetical protein EOP06_09305 [Proteobacteria bacterium]|nr:MAG: hypothetical protein EOP06_09305 [Pseudomonadota bacterium]
MYEVDPINKQAGTRPYSKKFSVSQTIASARLSGFIATPKLIADLELLATGKRTADELVATYADVARASMRKE